MTNSTRTILTVGVLALAACRSDKEQEAAAVAKTQPLESPPPEPGREHMRVVVEGEFVGDWRVVAEYEQAGNVHKTKGSLKRKKGASKVLVELLKHEVEDNKIIHWGDAETNGKDKRLNLYTTESILDDELSGSTNLSGYAETVCIVPQKLKQAFPVWLHILDRYTGQMYGTSLCR